jgi:enoyl-CoA hydratase/3-hydroxyacyl-CoA dehydrogenase
MTIKDLYPSFQNPFLIRPTRPIPKEMAVLGAGHIGPDIAYSFRLAFPQKKLYLVDVVEEPLKKAQQRAISNTPPITISLKTATS